MTVMAAPLTASCLLPEAAPPDCSNSLLASAIAMLINWVWEPPPLELPDVNCLRIWREARNRIRNHISMRQDMWAYLHSSSTAHGSSTQAARISLLISLLVRILDVLLVDGSLMLLLLWIIADLSVSREER